MITHETRRESYNKVDAVTRQGIVLQTFRKFGDMTARECAAHLGFYDLNGVKPRITELCQKGILEAFTKQLDPITNRKVAVYRIKASGPGKDAQLRLKEDSPSLTISDNSKGGSGLEA